MPNQSANPRKYDPHQHLTDRPARKPEPMRSWGGYANVTQTIEPQMTVGLSPAEEKKSASPKSPNAMLMLMMT
jgi:hypothetical protein